MDVVDDSWTYEDPSVESLVVEEEKSISSTDKSRESLSAADPAQNTSGSLESPITIRSPDGTANTLSQNSTPIISVPPRPITMKTPSPVLIPQRKTQLNPLGATDSSVGSNKSTPANPLTTKHDVNSVPVVHSSASSVSETVSDLANLKRPSTPTSQSGGFFNSMMTSLSFSNSDGKNIQSDGDLTMSLGSPPGSESERTTSSPNIISYRRSKRGKKRNPSSSSIDLPLSPLNEVSKPYNEEHIKEEGFDTTLYVDEKFKDTQYRFATESRNGEFHKIFKSIPEKERLLDDFSCALSREILLQGRIYVSEKNICFNSNLLGWVTTLVIPFSDITDLEKTATAGLFNNGIAIFARHNKKHSFATFLSRDATYDFLETMREANRGDINAVKDNEQRDLSEPAAFISKDLTLASDEYEEYNSALMSIDGDTPRPKRSYSLSTSNFDDEDEENESSASSNDLEETKLTTEKIYKFKEDSGYSYDGPYVHAPTSCDYDPESNQESILAKESFNCSPGILYEILFGKKVDFTLEFLRTQDGRDFSEFTDYKKNADSLERTYDYTKGLNFSVGPKSTKCLVTETVEHFDKEQYINIVNTTQTPDVPSGKAFLVKTRYIISWGPDNTSNMLVSFWIHWTGSSWMKAVIEKSCKSGQDAATKSLISLLGDYVAKYVEEEVKEVKITGKEIQPVVPGGIKTAAVVAEEEIKKEEVKVSSELTFGLPLFNILVLGLLTVIVVIQLLILISVRKISTKSSPLDFFEEITPGDGAQDLLFQGEELLIWNWIDERAGKFDGKESQRNNQLKVEIDGLLKKWAVGDLDTQEGKALIKDFGRHLNEYRAEMARFNGEEVDQKRAEVLRNIIKALL